jgi:hypothetical protein
MPRQLLIPVACASVALACAGLGVIASLNEVGWNTSALVRIHDTLPIAKLALRDNSSFRVRTSSGFYDGAFFYAIARDPLATGEAHQLMENTAFDSHRVVNEAPYYWGHPAYGWLAWLASVGGHPSLVPDALLAVGLIAIFVAGAAASVLAQAIGWSPWGGLVIALNPGLLFAVNHDTSEPVGAALLLLGLFAYVRGRRGWALGLLAALCFVKEPLVLVPLAIAGWEFWRTRRPPRSCPRSSGGCTCGSTSGRSRSARARIASQLRLPAGGAVCRTRRRNRGTRVSTRLNSAKRRCR